MTISVSQQQGRVPVTVINIEGRLDGQNYQDLINKGRELYSAGTRDVLLDLTNLSYISSAGMVAFHNIALLLRGETPPNPEQGWSAYRSMGRGAIEGGLEEHFKLFNPQPEVNRILDMVGFNTIFEIFTDMDQAIKSF
ncbi:MAG: STAS domain-containing protein [Anaerolineales bacterium]|nr:STAS domain-containing protein [Anaerolineales bacterium]